MKGDRFGDSAAEMIRHELVQSASNAALVRIPLDAATGRTASALPSATAKMAGAVGELPPDRRTAPTSCLSSPPQVALRYSLIREAPFERAAPASSSASGEKRTPCAFDGQARPQGGRRQDHDDDR